MVPSRQSCDVTQKTNCLDFRIKIKLLFYLAWKSYDFVSNKGKPFKSGIEVERKSVSNRDWVGVQSTANVKAIENHALDGCPGIEKEGRFQRRKAMGRESVCDPWISDRETVSKLRG